MLAVASGAAAAVSRPGSLDDGFGDGGRLSGQIGCVPLSVAGVERAEVGGGFLVVGSIERSSTDLGVEGGRLIVRGYDRRGRLDRDVGRSGTVLVPLPGGPAKAWGVARQPDGKLVVVGSVGESFPDPRQDVFVARFYPDGSLDAAFGSGGVVTTDLGGLTEEAKDVVVQPDYVTCSLASRLRDVVPWAATPDSPAATRTSPASRGCAATARPTASCVSPATGPT